MMRLSKISRETTYPGSQDLQKLVVDILEVTLCLLALDCRSSKLGKSDFFLLGLADIVFKGDATDDKALRS